MRGCGSARECGLAVWILEGSWKGRDGIWNDVCVRSAELMWVVEQDWGEDRDHDGGLAGTTCRLLGCDGRVTSSSADYVLEMRILVELWGVCNGLYTCLLCERLVFALSLGREVNW